MRERKKERGREKIKRREREWDRFDKSNLTINVKEWKIQDFSWKLIGLGE